MRKQKGLSQEETADLLNISQAAYARIENGKTNSWSIHLNKICQIFQCNPENLFDIALLKNTMGVIEMIN
nr:helix-turn-helix transcriptional regulator [Patiriisocius marinistellae]